MLIDVLQACASIATIAGVGIAIFLFVAEGRRRREDVEREGLGSLWFGLQSLGLEHPEFDPANIEVVRTMAGLPTTDDDRRRAVFFSLFFTQLGRVFRIYERHDPEDRQRRWSGWERYILTWHDRPDFAEHWALLKDQYDTEFVRRVDELLASR